MVPPDEHVCDSTTLMVCAHRTVNEANRLIKEARAGLKETQGNLLAQGQLNCVLVSQNCRIITRNTALEATLRELVSRIRYLSPGDNEFCQRAELVARGLSDLPPLEQPQ